MRIRGNAARFGNSRHGGRGKWWDGEGVGEVSVKEGRTILYALFIIALPIDNPRLFSLF